MNKNQDFIVMANWDLVDPEIPQYDKVENVVRMWVHTRQFEEDLENYGNMNLDLRKIG